MILKDDSQDDLTEDSSVKRPSLEVVSHVRMYIHTSVDTKIAGKLNSFFTDATVSIRFIPKFFWMTLAPFVSAALGAMVRRW